MRWHPSVPLLIATPLLVSVLLRSQLLTTAAPPAAKPSKPTGNSKPAATPKPAKVESPPARHALLIGVTKYPDVRIPQLIGPANDVALMRDLLADRFGFPSAQIVVLAEGHGDKLRPTRDNIEREFKRLGEIARDGDQVVILMSGHGTQQPDSNPPDPNDPEPDGLDEVFLPADTQPFDRRTKTMPRGIVDDELGTWIRRIRDRGAIVWLTVDSCHSGTIMRGKSDEVERRVPPADIIPQEELDAARQRGASAAQSTEAAATEPPLGGDLHNIVALYAAQPDQLTVELPLPRDAAQPQQYGLLTYTLNKVLTQARSPLTYAELAARISADYIQIGRNTPTPLLEGGDRDREVLGLSTWPGRSRMVLAKKPAWHVNAGALHGLTAGSILQALPPAGAGEQNTPLGHLRVKSVVSTSCEVEPCEYAKTPPAPDLPEGARCELVYLDCSLHKLRLATDIATESLRKQAVADIAQLAERQSLVQLAIDGEHADWILRELQGKLYLEPATGLDASDPEMTPRFGPADEKLAPWLEEHLRRIARGQNLLGLVRHNPADRSAGGDPDVEIELLRLRNKGDQDGQRVAWQDQGIVVHPGEIMACRVKNKGRSAVDVTFLYVDAGYGIQAVFPKAGTATDNRVYAGESLLAFKGTMNGKTLGMEHLVMIAVPGEGMPVDFSALEQPSLPQARGNGSADRGLNSPLGGLMRTALYGAGGTRGIDIDDFDRQSLGLISWRVSNKPAKAAKP
jgi:hypothetical protein